MDLSYLCNAHAEIWIAAIRRHGSASVSLGRLLALLALSRWHIYAAVTDNTPRVRSSARLRCLNLLRLRRAKVATLRQGPSS